MRKINLLYVITKLELGGAQKQLLSLIANLDKKRFNIFLFTAQNGLLIQDALALKYVTLIRSRNLERAINPLKDFLAFLEIYRSIKEHKIEIVHTHSSKAGVIGRWAAGLAKLNFIIHTVHGWSFNDYQPFFIRQLFIALERITARITDRLIVVSGHDREKGLRNHIGNEDKYALIQYGIDYAEFIGKDNTRGELGIGPLELAVGMVACFKAQKSPQDFIKVAFSVSQIISGVKFILIGDGVLRKPIEGLIKGFGLADKIMLTGWRRDVHRLLPAFDVFVLTSLWEGMPVSALEAMASSKPLVATQTGGIQEIVIEGETGFLVPRGDLKKMSEKLVLLLKDERLRKEMGRNARDFLGSDFKTQNMVKKNQDLYENLICKKEQKNAN